MKLHNALNPLLGFILLASISVLTISLADGDATASIFIGFLAIADLADAIGKIRHNLSAIRTRKQLEEQRITLSENCA